MCSLLRAESIDGYDGDAAVLLRLYLDVNWNKLLNTWTSGVEKINVLIFDLCYADPLDFVIIHKERELARIAEKQSRLRMQQRAIEEPMSSLIEKLKRWELRTSPRGTKQLCAVHWCERLHHPTEMSKCELCAKNYCGQHAYACHSCHEIVCYPCANDYNWDLTDSYCPICEELWVWQK